MITGKHKPTMSKEASKPRLSLTLSSSLTFPDSTRAMQIGLRSTVKKTKIITNLYTGKHQKKTIQSQSTKLLQLKSSVLRRQARLASHSTRQEIAHLTLFLWTIHRGSRWRGKGLSTPLQKFMARKTRSYSSTNVRRS
jgi:hypothetical protein